MKWVITGHRGVGKSSLLKRLQSYFSGVNSFDLDLEIEKKTGLKVSEIFQSKGEAEFRKIEIEVFNHLIQQPQFIISTGGGFNPESMTDNEIQICFVSRRTDSEGRIFLNRPRILPELDDLQESISLYNLRQARFINCADFIYHMPEGLFEVSNFEKEIFTQSIKEIKPFLTLKKNNNYEFQFKNLEIRTDIFSELEIEEIIQNNPDHQYLVSYRSPVKKLDLPYKNILFDWGLELGTPSRDMLSQIQIISSHDEPIETAIEHLKKYSQFILKLCPVINSWDQLILGFRWQQQDPHRRNFLPRSSSQVSRWRWFRTLMLNKQNMNFVQGAIDLDDQPSLFEVLKNNNINQFGAVVGNPIHHSFSPIVQNLLPIPLNESDFKLAIPFLTELGLTHAAMTSPLKKMAGQLCQSEMDCNSLVYKNKKWIGTSTDHFGFLKLFSQVSSELKSKIAVWGGSGVLSSLLKISPDLVFYSARTGDLKSGHSEMNPEALVWAAPRNPEIKRPWEIYPNWKPKIILDLNYTENSLGLECAKKYKAQYISGLEMFLEQAHHQRKFWKDHL